MADIVTFDAANLRIIEIDTGEDNILDAFEIYSEWKDWVKSSDNAKHPAAFRAIGGDPISEAEAVGSTFFLCNNWRIRPAEHDHKLTIDGNLFVDGGGSICVPTLGGYTVSVETKVSNLTGVAQGFEQQVWAACMGQCKYPGSVGEALWKAMLAKFDAPT